MWLMDRLRMYSNSKKRGANNSSRVSSVFVSDEDTITSQSEFGIGTNSPD